MMSSATGCFSFSRIANGSVDYGPGAANFKSLRRQLHHLLQDSVGVSNRQAALKSYGWLVNLLPFAVRLELAAPQDEF
jgi:hypothetical protein